MFIKKPPGLRCENLAKHFVPHAGSFSTLVQKYRSSVKALIHNSPPSVHSTCCVIKAVLYPLLLPLVSISPALSFSYCRHAGQIFFLIVLFFCNLTLFLLFSRSLCVLHCLTRYFFLMSYFSSFMLSVFVSFPRTKYLLSFFLRSLSAPLFLTSAHPWTIALWLTLYNAALSMTLHFTIHARSSSTLPGVQFAFFTTHQSYCPELCIRVFFISVAPCHANP